MRVALHNPINLIMRKNMDIWGWVLDFVRQERPYIYLSKEKPPARYFYLSSEVISKERIQEYLKSKNITYGDDMFISDIKTLNEKVDILLSLNGQNHRYPPEKNFFGIKVAYTDDYADYAQDCYRNLQQGGVSYVICNGQLDEYSEFFRKFYPAYVGKTKSICFGFSERFKIEKPFNKRINKCVAVGSVLPLRNQDRYAGHEVLMTVDNKVQHVPVSKATDKLKFWAFFKIINARQTKDFAGFYKKEKFLQPFRSVIVENEESLKDILDSKLPKYPKIKDYSFDMNACLNEYRMVMVDDGLLSFVGAKTFETMASGAVVVMPAYDYTEEWGFKHGENCIRYKPMDLNDFRDKVTYYIKHPKELEAIQANSSKFVQNFTHPKIAKLLKKRLNEIWDEARK